MTQQMYALEIQRAEVARYSRLDVAYKAARRMARKTNNLTAVVAYYGDSAPYNMTHFPAGWFTPEGEAAREFFRTGARPC